MTHHDMPAGAGHATPRSDEAPAGDAAQGSKGQTTTDAAIVADLGAERKALATLQAEAAFQGVELIALPDGRFIACRRGWCRLLRSLQDAARYLSRGWLA